jgi:hypothetical protein
MDLLAESQRDRSNDFDPLAGFSPWLEAGPSAADDFQPRYLVYSRAQLLGYTFLERVRAAGERSGRFYPDEDYFAYADIFAALPDAEDEWCEAAARTAYGIVEPGADESGKRFNELSAQVEALALCLKTEDGQGVEVTEIRLMDLSLKYDDQAERWLYVTLEQETTAELSQP